MKYKVIFTHNASKNIEKLDRSISSMILGWIRKNLENCDNPRVHGKALTGDLKGKWRYRVGDYRLICQIVDNQIIIYVLTVGHRKEIYK